jgi:photosystem II stability/assembly factor-like uncharacterized protein
METNIKTCLGFVALCILWVLSGCRPAPGWIWERSEAELPRQVVILALAADPENANLIWAGYYATEGLATSEDGGHTWTIGARGLRDNPVFDLLPLSGDVLWAGTRNGLMRSTDRGASWTLVAPPERLPSRTAFTLAADASGQIYAGFDDAGLYLGNPDQDTWKPLALDNLTVLSVAVSADGRFLYAGTAGRGLYASQDAGQSWTRAFTDDYVPNLAINPSQPTMAVASLRDRVILTRDGGQSWKTVPVRWASEEVLSLLWLLDPATESSSQATATGILLAGSGQGQIYCSQDGGESWEEEGSRVPTKGGVLALATAGDRLLAGTWTGVYASPAQSIHGPQAQASQCGDFDFTWTYMSPSLGLPNANTLVGIDDTLLIGTRAGLFRWQPTARRWAQVRLGDSSSDNALGESVTALAIAPSAEKVIYAGAVDGNLYRSANGGENWVQVLSELQIGIHALAVSPEDADRVYLLASWERLYESQDGGQSWQAHWTGLGVTTEAISLAIDPISHSTIYLGTDSGLYRSRYGGNDWQSIGHQLDDQTVLSLVADLALNADDESSILYIGATRGAYRSADGGETIEPWGQGLEGVSVTGILFDPKNSRNVYAGTAYAGLFGSVDGGETWQPIGPSKLAEETIAAMAWGPQGELFVASAGGVWTGRRE